MIINVFFKLTSFETRSASFTVKTIRVHLGAYNTEQRHEFAFSPKPRLQTNHSCNFINDFLSLVPSEKFKLF